MYWKVTTSPQVVNWPRWVEYLSLSPYAVVHLHWLPCNDVWATAAGSGASNLHTRKWEGLGRCGDFFNTQATRKVVYLLFFVKYWVSDPVATGSLLNANSALSFWPRIQHAFSEGHQQPLYLSRYRFLLKQACVYVHVEQLRSKREANMCSQSGGIKEYLSLALHGQSTYLPSWKSYVNLSGTTARGSTF